MTARHAIQEPLITCYFLSPLSISAQDERSVEERLISLKVVIISAVVAEQPQDLVYPQARHEIFDETNRDTVVDDLLAWLDQSSALDGAASATRGGAGRQTGKRRGTGEGAHVRPHISRAGI